MTNDKIKILFLAADPRDVVYRPALDREFREVGQKIRAGSERDSIELRAEFALRPEDLQQVLLVHRPHIVHFSGHGRREGLVLQDDKDKTQSVNEDALADLFRILKDDIRVVVLNACYSASQAEKLRQIVDFTVGMSDALDDEAALLFSESFYRALAFGRSVAHAFGLANNALDIRRIPGSMKPRLLVKDGANPDVPFLQSLKTGDPIDVPDKASNIARARDTTCNSASLGGTNEMPEASSIDGHVVATIKRPILPETALRRKVVGIAIAATIVLAAGSAIYLINRTSYDQGENTDETVNNNRSSTPPNAENRRRQTPTNGNFTHTTPTDPRNASRPPDEPPQEEIKRKAGTVLLMITVTGDTASRTTDVAGPLAARLTGHDLNVTIGSHGDISKSYAVVVSGSIYIRSQGSLGGLYGSKAEGTLTATDTRSGKKLYETINDGRGQGNSQIDASVNAAQRVVVGIGDSFIRDVATLAHAP